MPDPAELKRAEAQRELEREYAAAIAEVTASISVARVAAVGNNVDQIMLLLNLTQARLGRVLEAVRKTFAIGGQTVSKQARIVFDLRNPTAEDWLRLISSRLVTTITTAQRDAIRETLAASMMRGDNPRRTALDIVGRIGENGRRVGGIVGLTGHQARYLESARGELSDPGRMANYFTRSRRDRRFDGAVSRAMSGGKPLTRGMIDRIAGRYAARLLQTRGEAIARTESLAALNAGRDQAFQQARGEGKVSAVTRVWQSAHDARTRRDHAEMDGQATPMDQPFIAPDGSRLMYPGDASRGASAAETINCRCILQYRIDRFANLGAA